MARITATEMVGVPFSTREVERLLDALACGKLGAPDDSENVTLQRKLTVLLQVAKATERRKAAAEEAPPAAEHARGRARPRGRRP